MERFIDELVKILSAMLSTYEDLYELQKRQTAVIIAGDMEKLQEILRQEDAIITSLGELERARSDIVMEIFRRGNWKEEISLTDIASLGIRRDELLEIQNRLKSVINDVSQQNSLNGKLVKQALEYIDRSIDAIKSAMVQDNGIYKKESKQESVISLFDRKV